MRTIRARTIGSVTIAAAMALTACTSGDGDPVADGSPSPAVSASAEPTPADDGSDTPDVEQVDGEGEPSEDLPETNPKGMTAAEARAAGWDLHPELPDNTKILVDLRTHRGYGDEPVTPEIVPSLWDFGQDGITERDVNKALDNEKQCLQDYEFTYKLREYGNGGQKIFYDCEYTGSNYGGDTGVPLLDVTYEDILLADDGRTVEVDNIMCDFTIAPIGCPRGDLTFTTTDSTLAITFRGFDRENGTPMMWTDVTTDGPTSSRSMECHHNDPTWFNGEARCALLNSQGKPLGAAGSVDTFDVAWADDETVTLTYPTAIRDVDDSPAGTVAFDMQMQDGTVATFHIGRSGWRTSLDDQITLGRLYDLAVADTLN